MSEKPRLKITDVKSISLRTVQTVGEITPAWDPRIWSQSIGGGSFVEVHTDQGLTGIGPAVDARLIPVLIKVAPSLMFSNRGSPRAFLVEGRSGM